jgi:crotonobetainyl-CoA:carnitine CoA-transferase CaiB-like acyl-CoA transferase
MKPLAGMRVIAIEQYGAAPYGTMMLAALGADILKVEHAATGGDPSRHVGGQGLGPARSADARRRSLTGESDGPPARVGASMVDTLTGLTGMVGLLSCVMQARRTGRGCDVDTCLFDVALHQLTYAGVWYLNAGDEPERLSRSAHLLQVPVQTFPTADGWIFIMCMTEKFWRIFCDVVARPDLPEDRRFATADRCRENREALIAQLDQELRRHPTEHWLALLTGKVPVAPVYDVATALDAPFTRRIGMVQSVTHPARSELVVLANPLKIDGVRLPQRVCASLGADNALLQPEEPTTA